MIELEKIEDALESARAGEAAALEEIAQLREKLIWLRQVIAGLRGIFKTQSCEACTHHSLYTCEWTKKTIPANHGANCLYWQPIAPEELRPQSDAYAGPWDGPRR